MFTEYQCSLNIEQQENAVALELRMRRWPAVRTIIDFVEWFFRSADALVRAKILHNGENPGTENLDGCENQDNQEDTDSWR